MKWDYDQAKKYIDTQLQTNTKNPVRMGHAALIYERDGDKAKAKHMMDEAMKNKPNINALLQQEIDTVFNLKA